MKSWLAASREIADSNEELLVYNIDTYVEPEQLKKDQIRGEGWVPAFVAEGERWSFVKIDEDQRVTEITEKVRISQYGTIGLYYFSSFALYQQLYRSHPFASNKERYIAPMYDLLIQDPARSIYSHIIDESAVHVLGTPEDLRNFSLDFQFPA